MSEKQDNRSFLEQNIDASVKSFFAEVCDFVLNLGILPWLFMPIAPVASIAGFFLLPDYSSALFYAYLVGAGLFILSIVFGVAGFIYFYIEKSVDKPTSTKVMIASGYCYVASSLIGIYILIQLFRAISDFLFPIIDGV